MTSPQEAPAVVSVMLAVPDAQAAARWYAEALGATRLWDLGSVVGLELAGAPFMLGEPEGNGWQTPAEAGLPTVRIEVFTDDPDALVGRAVAAGADGRIDAIRDHEMPWGPHRQGGFVDPYGHRWLVGDRTPLARHTDSELTRALGKVARRELAAHGFLRYEQLTAVSSRDLLRIHGVGPKAVRLLAAELSARGLGFVAS